MARLKRLEQRIADLEKKMEALGRLKLVNDSPSFQVLSAEVSGAAVLIKTGPTSGALNLSAGTLNLR